MTQAADRKQENRDRAEQFLREFNDLCKKHNTWIEACSDDQGAYLSFYVTDLSRPGVAINEMDADRVRIDSEDKLEPLEDIPGLEFD